MTDWTSVNSTGMYTRHMSMMPRSSLALTALFRMMALVYDTFWETYLSKENKKEENNITTSYLNTRNRQCNISN